MAHTDVPCLPEITGGILPFARVHHTERPCCGVGQRDGEEAGTRQGSPWIHRGTSLAEQWRRTLSSYCWCRLCGEYVQTKPLENQSFLSQGLSLVIIKGANLLFIIIIILLLRLSCIIHVPQYYHEVLAIIRIIIIRKP